MKRKQKFRCGGFVPALAVSATLLGVVEARGDHTVVLSADKSYKYTVSDDGMTWTKGNQFNTTFLTAVAPGDGYVYSREGKSDDKKIGRFNADGTYVSNFVKSDSYTEHLCVSADKVWIYASTMKTADAEHVIARYRLSDSTIGGEYLRMPQAQIRQMACGNDGYLYLSSRTLPGAYAYDVTGAKPMLATSYKAGDCKGGIVLDEKNGKINILGEKRVTQFTFGDSASTYIGCANTFDNPFASCVIDEIPYGCSWANSVIVKIGVGSVTYPTIDTKLSQVNGMLPLDDVDTGTKLPNITGVWYMNETVGSCCNGANPGVMTLTCFNGASNNVAGVVRGGLYLGNSAFGKFADSQEMFPSTGDFTFSSWAAFPKRAAERTMLSNGVASFVLDSDGKFGFACGEVKIVSTDAVDDGKWHHLAVIRRSGKLEVWVDGAKQSDEAFDAATAIAGTSIWCLGVGADGSDTLGESWFDEIRAYPVALPASDIAYLIKIAAKDGIAALPLPTDPQPVPEYSSAEAEKLGTVVDHEYSGDALVGATSMAKVGDDIYLVRDRGIAYFNPGAGGVLYRSTDGGTTWSKVSSFDHAQASLFTNGTSVYALALDAQGKIFLGTLNGEGAFGWTASNFFHPIMTACQPILKDNRVWLGYRDAAKPLQFGFVSAAFDGSTLSDFKTYTNTEWSNAQKGGNNGFLVEGLQGVPVVGTNGYVTVISPITTKIARFTKNQPWKKAPEQVQQTIATSTTAGTACLAIRFPGGAKPFAITYDSTSARYWAVVVPQHDADAVDFVCPQDMANKLAIYSSPDLVEWRFHGDIANSGSYLETSIAKPSMAVVGDNLVIAFAAKVDDGTGISMPAPHDGNFLVTKKVANFRSLYRNTASWPRDHKYIVALQSTGPYAWNSGNCLMKYYRDKASGDWLVGGILLHGCGGQAVRTYGDRIYIGIYGNKDNLKVYSSSGQLLKTLTACPTAVDSIAISPDGRYVYCANQSTTVGIVNRVDTRDWSVTEFINDNDILMPRSILMMPDGSLVVGSRNGKNLVKYAINADGSLGTKTVLSSGIAYQSICLNDDASQIWFGLQSDTVGNFTFATSKVSTAVFDYDIFDLLCYNGELFCSTYGNEGARPGGFGKLSNASGAFLTEYVATLPCGGGNRMAVLEVPPPGVVLIFK